MSTDLLESQLKILENRRSEYIDDLEAVFLGWLDVCADDICRRIDVLDRDIGIIKAQLSSARSLVSKGTGVYITK